MCKRQSCNVFKALILAILLPIYANAQDTDSTTVAQSDSAATTPEKTTTAPDASGFTSAFENTFSIITLVLPHNSLRNSKTLHNWPFIAFSVPGWALNFNIQKNMGPLLTLKGSSGGNLGFEGINLRAGVSLELIHLLELPAGDEHDHPQVPFAIDLLLQQFFRGGVAAVIEHAVP